MILFIYFVFSRRRARRARRVRRVTNVTGVPQLNDMHANPRQPDYYYGTHRSRVLETADRTRAAVTVWIPQPVVIGRQAGARNAIVVERKNIGARALFEFYSTRPTPRTNGSRGNIFFILLFLFLFFLLINLKIDGWKWWTERKAVLNVCNT